MKKLLLLLAVAVGLCSLPANAQLLKGDINNDGIIDVNDINGMVAVVLGDKEAEYLLGGNPNTVDNSYIAGTWNKAASSSASKVMGKSAGEQFTLNADGTTDYEGATTFKFLPYQARLVFMDAGETPVVWMDVVSLTDKTMWCKPSDTGVLTKYSKVETKEDNSGVDENGHEYVDLGLPGGVLWATCNVGAEQPEKYGLYFAWGETNGCTRAEKRSFYWSVYKWSINSTDKMNKYCTNPGEGTVDKKTELDADDDAATKNWGEGWRMPTRQEFADLISDEYTTHEWVTVNGVTGQKITSKSNGNSIFLPATGYRNNVALYYNDTNGYYWTKTVSTDFNYDACMLCFNSGGLSTNSTNRFNGLAVRAVRVAK